MSDRISHGSAVAAVALAAIVARAIFGLNGSQYDSWVVALEVMAAVLAIAALLVFAGVIDLTHDHARRVVAACSGLAVVALAVLTTQLYSDGSTHYPYWPHALAWIGLTVFAVGIVALLSRKRSSA